MTQHTNWYASEEGGHGFWRVMADDDKGSFTIADVFGEDEAKRIVACVNACAGISTDYLRIHKVTSCGLTYTLLEQQRDQAFKDLAEIRALVGAQTEELIQDAIKRLIAERNRYKADFEAQFNV